MTRSTAALAARGLTVGYRDHVVIDGLDLSIAAGRVTALCGPNGCGKSTLLRTLAGLQPALAGQVDVNGRPLASFRRRALARELTMLAQFNQIPSGLTVRELVAHGRTDEEVARIIGADHLVYQDVDALKQAVRDINPEIKHFEASCFDGDYITGDITAAYLDGIETARLAPQAQSDRDAASEALDGGMARSQLHLQLSVE